jgi:hypothetical protein
MSVCRACQCANSDSNAAWCSFDATTAGRCSLVAPGSSALTLFSAAPIVMASPPNNGRRNFRPHLEIARITLPAVD